MSEPSHTCDVIFPHGGICSVCGMTWECTLANCEECSGAHGSDSSPERRAEEPATMKAVAESYIAVWEGTQWNDGWPPVAKQAFTLAQFVVSLVADLDRISAEREAYREALERIASAGTTRIQHTEYRLEYTTAAAEARRILAENDR